MSNNDSDAELCKKINSIMDEFEKKIEKETGCSIEGTAICFTGKGNDYQLSIHTGPYENINVMEGKTVDLDVDYSKN